MSNIYGANPIISNNIYTKVEHKIIKMHEARITTQSQGDLGDFLVDSPKE